MLTSVTMPMVIVVPERHRSQGTTKQAEGPCDLTGETGIVNQATETIMAEEASRQVLDRGVVGIRLPGFKKPRGCSYSWVTSASPLAALSFSLSCNTGLIIVSTSYDYGEK